MKNEVWPGYTNVRKLGEGNYAEAYLVKNSDGSEAALKWFKASRDGRNVRDAEREALAAFSYPRIPALLDEGEAEGRPFLVMEYARGDSLAEVMRLRIHEGGALGVWPALRLLRALCETLAGMHGAPDPWVHRDLKPANLIARKDLTDLVVVDFGYARRVGDSRARTNEQFWNGGAALYSPPEKLRDDPNSTDPSQDVFAAGVIAYYLITAMHPWRYAQGEDRMILASRMERERPAIPTELNAAIPLAVSKLIERMINLQADKRPLANEVAVEIERLLAEASSAALQVPDSPGNRRMLQLPRVIRDPVHGDVRLTEHEWSVLNTPELQRLRWMRQLGLTTLVYPGADHSRLSHVIGTLHVTERILTSLEQIQGIKVEPDLRLTARLYALVHDVAHIPFGHTIEDELGYFRRHDENEPRIARLVTSSKSALGRVLGQTEYGNHVIALLDPQATIGRRTEVTEIVGGSTGADVIDYIDRDSLFCGLDHRVDTALYRQFRLDFPDPAEPGMLLSQLHDTRSFRLDRQFAIEALLLSRYALFLKVYTHPLKLSAAAMLDKALFDLLGKDGIDETTVEWMSDGDLLGSLKHSTKKKSSLLGRALVERTLFRPAYWGELLPEHSRSDADYRERRDQLTQAGLLSPQGRRSAERTLARLLKGRGVKADDIAVHCAPSAPGHQRVRPRVIDERGNIDQEDMAEPYKSLRALHVGLWGIHVFTRHAKGSTEWHAIQEAAEDYFTYRNIIYSDRRQQRFPI